VFDGGGRAATTTFAQRSIGDALCTFESEVNLIRNEFGDNFEVVYPKSTILAENPVSVIDKVVDKKGTRKQAEAYLKFLWSDEAQEIAARHQLRPRSAALLAKYAKDFPKVQTFTIDEFFGGWTKAQKEHFDDGAIYDQILAPRTEPDRRFGSMLFSRTLLRRHSVLPGFDLALGFTLLYLSLIVLVPLAAAFLKTATMTWPAFWSAVSSARVVASYRLTFGASFLAAAVNAVFGLLVCWVLVRYEFPGRRFRRCAGRPAVRPAHRRRRHRADGAVLGQRLDRPLAAVQGELHAGGVWVALTFIGLPFVVRTLQPVLEDLQKEIEEAAATLGATAGRPSPA
jgi:hypothetical protein